MKTKILIFLIIILSVIFFFKISSAQAADPVLFFSDLTSGPKTGWEGSTTKGAAVTIWGKNFGSTRGSSYVAINGAQLTNASDYAEWGTTGTANGVARGLERTTFWIPSTATDGAGTISVNVGGAVSNTLPFTIRSGNIFFISRTDGSDSYDGAKATNQGSNHGPWRHIKMVDRTNNSLFVPGSIAYVRGGYWLNTDAGELDTRDRNNWINMADRTGTATMPYAVISYPGEIAKFKSNSPDTSFLHTTAVGFSHWVFSKFWFVGNNITGSSGGGEIFGPKGGKNYRIIGNTLEQLKANIWSGNMMIDTVADTYIFGNYFNNDGYDKYAHNIYIKSHQGIETNVNRQSDSINNVHVAYNEFYQSTSEYGEGPNGGTVEVQTEGGASYKSHDVYIYSNFFNSNKNEDLSLSGSDRIYVYNNLFFNNLCPSGSIGMGSLTNSGFYNNTIYRNISVSGGGVFSNNAGSPWPAFKNNIFYVYSNMPIIAVGSEGGYTSDYDLYFNTSVPAGTVTHYLTSDPLFINAAGYDFHLQSASPAKDAGTQAVSSIVTQDYDAISRPQGSAYDIGAFEYISGSTPPPDTTPPSPPSNVAVN